MDYTTKYITPDIKLSCYTGKLFKTETMFQHHMLVWFISGETKLIQAGQEHVFKTGDIFLIPRNQLATVINYPVNGLPHKSVVMHLTTQRLQAFYAGLHIKAPQGQTAKVLFYNHHPLLQSCLASLVPYFDLKDLPANIATLKINEAISILRVIDENIDNVLANFDEPGKIGLADFMEKNFMFNMPLQKFGYLTGRSLSTFNRDFKTTFNTSPQKWLTQKRLELAHYQLTQKNRRPADVYLETGFEDLSHFSFAFKKYFGYAPSSLAKKE